MYEIAHLASMGAYVQECWRRRDLGIVVPLERYRSAHSQTTFGAVWIFLNPTLQVFVYYLIFGVIAGDITRGVPNLLSFLAVGLFLFRFPQATITDGARAITGNLNLIRTVYFPRAVLPFQALMTNLYDLVPTSIVMFAFILIVGDPPRWSWLLYPVFIVPVALISLGGALISARVNATFRDWSQILPFLFRIGMYVSAVIFPLESRVESDWGKALLDANPFYAIVSVARTITLGYDLTEGSLLSLLAWATVLPVAGLWLFRRAEYRYGG